MTTTTFTPPFEAHKDSLGKPREGFHATRIPCLDVALWDTLGTAVIALLVAKGMGWGKVATISGAFLLGIILHALFGVPTKLNTSLGISSSSSSLSSSATRV